MRKQADLLTAEEIREIKKLSAGYVYAGGVLRCSTRVKYYGDEVAEVMMCNKTVFRHPDSLDDKDSIPSENVEKTSRDGHIDVENFDDVSDDDGDDVGSVGTLERSRRRARKNVFDYAMCNPDLNIFFTFTLAPDKVDRTDYKAVIKKMNVWLSNRVQRSGLKYIMVAEYHKDGKGIHFHGLANRKALTLQDSGHKDRKGHKIYNLTDWELGFSTAIRVYGKSRGGVCKYICKYISKSVDKVGGRWYYSGGDLAAPTYEYLGDTDPDDWAYLGNDYELYTKCVEEIGTTYTILSKKWK